MVRRVVAGALVLVMVLSTTGSTTAVIWGAGGECAADACADAYWSAVCDNVNGCTDAIAHGDHRSITGTTGSGTLEVSGGTAADGDRDDSCSWGILGVSCDTRVDQINIAPGNCATAKAETNTDIGAPADDSAQLCAPS